MGSIPGFEPFAFAGSQGRKLVHDVITLRLNRALRESCANTLDYNSEM